jgi:hypothetical protein
MYTIKGRFHDLTVEMWPEHIINSSDALTEANGPYRGSMRNEINERSLISHGKSVVQQLISVVSGLKNLR